MGKLLAQLAAGKFRKKPLIEELEARILYSADASSLFNAAAYMPDAANIMVLDDETDPSGDTAQQTAPSQREVVFVDTRVENYQQLVDDIKNQDSATKQVEVVLLDRTKDGIATILDTLATKSDISAIHLIGEGSSGQLHLGTSFLNAETLNANYAEQLRQIGSQLNTDADILIYGCNFGQGDYGQSAVEMIANLTGADVAASSDRTGHISEFGNWALEINYGIISTDVAVSAYGQANWFGALSTFTVTNTNSSGAGSLADAALLTNLNPGADTIAFAISGAGTHTINLSSSLVFSEQVTIDGASQTGYSGNPLIVLNGGNSTNNGIILQSGFSVVRGLTIQNFTATGIVVQSSFNTIEGNWIGLSADGLSDGGALVNGIVVANGNNNVIGGSTAAQRNVISGVFNGIQVEAASGTKIMGNYIGTNFTGTAAVANNTGIYLTGANSLNTTIGSDLNGTNDASEGNLISGNDSNGVLLNGPGVSGTKIYGNIIGLNIDQTAVIGNLQGIVGANSSGNFIGSNIANGANIIGGGTFSGVGLFGGNNNKVQGNIIGTNAAKTLNFGNSTFGVFLENGASNNVIGGTAAGQGNVIVNSGTAGIGVKDATTQNNAFLGNNITLNTGLGIDIGPYDSFNINDPSDIDTGANNLQNYPLLGNAIINGNSISIDGNINSQANTNYRIEFFSNPLGTEDPTGYGEGRIYLGFVNATTNGSGNVSFSNTINGVTVTAGDRISATATVDLGGGNFGATSEFGLNIIAEAKIQIVVAKDTYIQFNNTTLNYGNSTNLVIDRETNDLQRALLQFDLSSIPLDAIITNASLAMQSSQIGGTINVSVYELIHGWTEGSSNGTSETANWSQSSVGTNWSSAGGDFASTPVANLNTSATGQHTWNLTNLVKAWFDGSKINNGVLIASQDGGGNRTVTYDSGEGTTPPILLISYTLPIGAIPAITLPTGVNVTEDTALSFTGANTISIADTNNNLTSARLTITNGNLLVNLAGGATISAGVNNSSTLTLAGTQAQINAALATLSYQAALNFSGAVTLNILATDSTTATDNKNLTIQVIAINDAPSFGVGTGIVLTNFSNITDEATSVVLQPDGKIIVGGTVTNGGSDDFALTRYNSDGSLDNTFSGDGKLITSFGAGTDAVKTVLLQTDGKIVVTGRSLNTVSGRFEFAVARYNSDGTLDTTFSGDGKATTSVGVGQVEGGDGFLQADGKIVVAGSASNGSNFDFALVRFNTDGTLDTTFSGDGKQTIAVGTLDDFANVMTVQADGKIVLGGTREAGASNDYVVMRLLANGNLDTSFAGTGIAITDIAGQYDTIQAIALQPDGKIVVAGYSDVGGQSIFSLARYNTNGSSDTSFSGDGKATASIGSLSNFGESLAIQADGKILLTGGVNTVGSDYTFGVVRFNTDGSLDTTFSGDGKLTTVVGTGIGQDYPEGVTVQADGKIIVVGSAVNVAGDNDFAVVRYNTDGTLDTSFNLVSSLNNTVTYIEDASPVILNSLVTIRDAELDALNAGLGNYNGAYITLQRDGGPNAQDAFSATGALSPLVQGGNLVIGGVTIGTVITNSNGTLTVLFDNNATTARVNAVARSIAYANTSNPPPSIVSIFWVFNDVNTGAQGIGGAQVDVGNTIVNITPVNDAPVAVMSTIYSLDEDFISPLGASVGGLTSSLFTDADGTSLAGILITGNAATAVQGNWQYSTNNGVNWYDIGQVPAEGLALSVSASLRFVPAANHYGSAGQLTILGVDASYAGVYTTGAARVSIAGAVGGTTPLSGTAVNIFVDIDPVNDAPSFSIGTGIVKASFVNFDDNGKKVVVQPDGKILVAGYTQVAGVNNFGVMRFNPDGTLDTSFSADGKLTTAVGANDIGLSMVLQADGKILVAGYTGVGASDDFALVRYNSDGSLDTSFSGDGKLTTSIGSGNDAGVSLAIQTDGKIVLAGSSNNGGNTNFAVARYNTNGTLDTSFSSDGLVSTPVGAQSSFGQSVTIQVDGKILVAGYTLSGSPEAFAVVRYNANGTLDTSFSGDGILTTDIGTGNDRATTVAVQNDGKIIVGGYSASGAVTSFALVRYNADGSLDTSYSGDGIQTTAFANTSFGTSLTLQSDGKALLAGYVLNGANYDFAIVRLELDGSLDTNFSADGKQIIVVGTGFDLANSVTMQADGKILIAGQTQIGTNNDFALVRLNSDGSLDNTFNLVNTLDGNPTFIENGAPVVLDANVQIRDIDLDFLNGGLGNYDGSTLTLGRDGGYVTEDVFSATGNLNALIENNNLVLSGVSIGTVTSNGIGILQLNFNSNATTARVNEVMQSIAYSNTSNNPPATVQIAWVFLDDELNVGSQGAGGPQIATGITVVNITAVNDAPTTSPVTLTAIAEDSGQRIITQAELLANAADVEGTILTATNLAINAGTGNLVNNGNGTWTYTPFANDQTSVIFSYIVTDGTDSTVGLASLDITPVNDAPSFNVGGNVITTFASDNEFANATAIQADGKIVVAGTYFNGSTNDILIVRYNTNGTLDSTFGINGIVNAAPGSGNDSAQAVSIQADGKIVVVGSSSNGTNLDFVVLRYNANGSLDNSFSGNGVAVNAVGAGDDIALSMTIQVDGKILVSGFSNNGTNEDFALVRYNTNGTLDTTFSGDGIVTTNIAGSNDYGESVVVQADGKILQGGHSNDGASLDFSIARYNADGTLDNSFSADGIVTTDFAGGQDEIQTLLLQADGKIIAVGQASNAGNNDFAVARYNSDGTLDTSFSLDGKVTATIGAGDDAAYAAVLQSDGKIITSGRSFNGTKYDFALARFNSDGTLDNSFSSDGKLTKSVGVGNDFSDAVVLQADGRIVQVGYSNNGTNNDISVVRYLNNGNIDNSFAGVTTLGGNPTFVENGTPVILDANVQIRDSELDALNGGLGNYNGTRVSLLRAGGSSAQDVFTTTGNLSTGTGAILTAGVSNLTLSGLIIGSVTLNSNGQLTIDFNFNATTARVNEVMQSIAYSNTSDNPPATVQINWVFNDDQANTGNQGAGGPQTAIGSTIVNITGVNDEPFPVAPSSISVNEDGLFAFTGTNTISVNSIDGGLDIVVVSVANGRLVANLAGGAVLSAGLNNSPSFELSGTEAQINAALATLTYRPATNFNGADTLTISARDFDGQSNSTIVSITVNAINDAPVLTGNANLISINEDVINSTGQAISSLFSGLFSDVDAGSSLVGVAVTSNTASAAEGIWQFSANGGTSWDDIGIAASPTSSVLLSASTLIRFVPAADYNGNPIGLSVRALDNSYAGTFSSSGTYTLRDTTVNGGATDISASLVTINTQVNAVNDAPVNLLPTAQVVAQNGILTLGGANSILVSDKDAGTSPLRVTISASNGLISLSETTGLTFTVGDGTNDSTFTFEGTLLNINNALTGMTFSPTLNYSGAATITVTTSDLGNSGSGGALTDTDVLNISVNGNIAPVITSNGGGASAGLLVAENTTAVTTVIATDADLPAQTLTYSISGTDASKFTISATGVLSFILAPDFETPTDSDTNGIYDVDVQVSDGITIDTQLIRVTVTNVNDNSPVITSNGGGVIGNVSINENTTAVTTVTANDADLPAQTITYSIVGGVDAARFTINSATGVLSFVVAPNYEVPTDSDTNGTYDVTVQATDGTFTDTQDIYVSVNNLNEVPSVNLTGSPVNEDSSTFIVGTVGDVDGNISTVQINVNSGTLNVNLVAGATISSGTNGSNTLTLSGTLAQINAAISAINYQGNLNFNGTDVLTMTATDTNSSTASLTYNIIVNAVNDAPNDGLTPIIITTSEDAGLPVGPVGSLISAFTSNTTDVDIGSVKGIAIITNSPTNGTWYYSANNGTNWSLVGAVSSTSALLLADNVNTRLYFAPNTNYNGTETGALTILAWDQTSGTAGTQADTTVQGGTSAFSSSSDQVDVTITAVNDAPTTTVVTLAAIAEDSGIRLITQAELLANASDVDSSLTATNLSISSGLGSLINNNDGTWSYTPALNDATAVSFSYTVTDGSLTAAGSATLDITPVNDEQTIVTNTGLTITENSSGNIISNSSLQTTDVDNTLAQIVYTVTNAPANGQIFLNGILLGVNSVFTQAQINAGLLTYTHNGSETNSDAFSFSVNDGSGAANTDTFNITVTPVNDNAPVIAGGASIAININENSTAVTTVSATDADIPSGTITYSINGGADAAKFSINASTGVLTFIVAPDFENPTDNDLNNIYNLSIRASDGILASTQIIAVTVLNLNEAPTTSNVTLTALAEDTSRLITQTQLLGNASDVDGSTLNAINLNITSGNGSLIDNGNGTWTYTPNLNYNGTVNFDYSISDGSLSVTGTASLLINPVNDAPITSAVTLAAIAEDSGIRLITQAELLANASDVDSSLTATNLSISSGLGSLINNNDGTWSYTPALNDATAVSFSYTVTDGSLTAAGSATLDITPVNDAPTTTAVTLAAIAEDSGIRLITQAELLANASDVDSSLTATNLSISSGLGSLINNNDGTWSYTPALNDATAVSFSYTVTDGSLTAAGSATLDITPVNDAPTTTAVTLAAIAEDSGIRLITQAELLANASDVDSSLTATNLSISSGLGSLINNNDGTWSYTPALNDATAVSFSYTVTDGSLTAAGSATLDITPVNDAPTTTAVTLAAIAEDSGIRLITQAELLANASDVDSSLTATNLSISSGLGSLINNNDGTWSYTPALNDATAVSFSYTVTDGSLTAAGSATLDITPVNDAPTTTAVTLAAIAEDSGIRLITQAELLANASDVDSSLTATNLSISSGLGSLINNNDGTWSYTPALNDATAVSFSYTVTDGSLTAAGSATLDITPVNDAPTNSGNITLPTILENSGSHIINLAQLLVNASDVDGPALSAINLIVSVGGGSIVDNGNGTWTYSTAANYNGAASINYLITDGTSSVSNTANFTILPATANLAVLPSIIEDGGSKIVTQTELVASAELIYGTGLIASNLTITAGNGNLANNGDGTWTYTPAANDDTGVFFSYLITLPNTTSVNGLATLDITPVNDAPTTTAVTLAAIAEDSGIRLITQAELLANASDVDSSLTATNLSISSGLGSLINNNDGTWSYTPALNDATAVSFSYTVTDGSLTAAGSATLDITPVNDAPTTTAVTLAAIAEDSGIRLITQAELLANASDVDSSLTATNLSISSGLGSLINNNDGTWSYTPALNDATAVSFSYTVTDGSLTAAGSATLDITPVNDAPTTTAVTLAAIAEDSGIRLITQAELLANASDVDSSLTATNLSISSGLGSLINNNDGTWSYTPALNDATAVSFSYTVTDGSLTAAGSATLDITPVNDAPTTTAVTLAAIAEDSGIRLITQAELLANASDVDSSLTATNLSISSGLGSLINNNDGTWSYTPALNDATAVSFSYTVTDGSLTAAGSATLDITPVNDAPTTTAVTLAAIAEDSGAQIISAATLLQNALDTDGNPLTITNLMMNSNIYALNYIGNSEWTFTPPINLSGTVVFSYDVTDGINIVPTTATMNITQINDEPTSGNVNLGSIANDKAITITLSNLLANANDVENDNLSIIGLTLNTGAGALVSNGNNTWSFTPDINYSGQVFFTYVVSDGALTTPGSAQLNVIQPAIIIVDVTPTPPPKETPTDEVEVEVEVEVKNENPTGIIETEVNDSVQAINNTLPDFASSETSLNLILNNNLFGAVRFNNLISFANNAVTDITSNINFNTSPANSLNSNLTQIYFDNIKRASYQVSDINDIKFNVSDINKADIDQVFTYTQSYKLGLAVTAGAVAWAALSSGFLASLLAAFPAWRHLDPIPILGKDDDDEEEDWDLIDDANH